MMYEIDAKKSHVHLNLNQKPELTKRLNLVYMLQPHVWSRADKAIVSKKKLHFQKYSLLFDIGDIC